MHAGKILEKPRVSEGRKWSGIVEENVIHVDMNISSLWDLQQKFCAWLLDIWSIFRSFMKLFICVICLAIVQQTYETTIRGKGWSLVKAKIFCWFSMKVGIFVDMVVVYVILSSEVVVYGLRCLIKEWLEKLFMKGWKVELFLCCCWDEWRRMGFMCL
jgi:hypothetical protein